MNFYRDLPIFNFPVDWSEPAVVRFMYQLPVRQIGFGDASLEPEQNHLAQGFELSVDLQSIAQIRALEAFWQRCHGRLRGFWLPGPLWEMECHTRIDDHCFSVPFCGLEESWENHPNRFLWIADPGETPVAVKITSVASDGMQDYITTEEVLPAWLGDGVPIARLYFVRFSEDSLEIQMEAPAFASARVRCYELPLEYIGAELGDRPVWLYEFNEEVVAGDANTWRFTSHDVEVEAEGHAWTPTAFSHGSLMETVRGEQDELELQSFSFEGNPLTLFLPFAPQRRLFFTLRELRLDDGQAAVRFAGEVRKVTAEGRVLEARVATRLDAENRQMPRLLISRVCSYNLGDAACGKDLQALRVEGVVTAANGVLLTFPAGALKPSNWFAGGYCILLGGAMEREVRQIIASEGVAIYLQAPFSSSPDGLTLRAFPGCDHRASTCEIKFDNFDNFGGHLFVDRNLALQAVKRKQAAGGKK